MRIIIIHVDVGLFYFIFNIFKKLLRIPEGFDLFLGNKI